MAIIRSLLAFLLFPLLGLATENPVVAKMRAKAEQGVAGAQYNLAELYANGTSVARDPAVAVVWYRKAAEQGSRDAQFKLALAYLEGNGVDKDKLEGLAWLKVAAVGGGATMARFRDKLEEDLSPAAIAAADRRREIIELAIAARKQPKAK